MPSTRKLAVDLVNSSGLNTTANASGLPTGQTDIATLVGTIIGAVLSLAGIVLVVLFVYAGFLWMTAQGDDAKVKQAKSIIKNAVIGTILTFSAYTIAITVANLVASTTGG